jgi:hypothetical protein
LKNYQLKRVALFVVVLFVVVVGAGCVPAPTATPRMDTPGPNTPTNVPTETAWPTPSKTVSSTHTTEPTATPRNTAIATFTSPEPPRGVGCGKAEQPEQLLPAFTPTPGKVTPRPSVTPAPPVIYDLTQLSTRAGFGMANRAEPERWASVLKSGWYLSWDVAKRSPAQLPEHWQTVRVGTNCIYPSLTYLRWVATNYPGSVWMIGNEPDVIWQDNVVAEEYARLYHDAYVAIKAADPNARLAPGAISEATPLRLAYLDRVLAEYQKRYNQTLPVDWWNIHGYVLREERKSWGVEIPPGFTENQGQLWEVSDHDRLDLFKDQIKLFRRWMLDRGYRNTPLALTEFGILMPEDYGFPLENVKKYMQDTFQWLQNAQDEVTGYPGDDNKLVQKWAWFSLSYDLYPAPNLADLKINKLTGLGETFREYVLKYLLTK